MDNIQSKTHGLFGWISQYYPVESPANVLSGMKDAMHSCLPAKTLHTGHTACGSTNSIAPVGDLGFATIVGTPYWENKTLNQLSREVSPAAALAEAYRLEGKECIKQIDGAFALALFDPAQQQTLLGVDILGREQLYYTYSSDLLVFASSAQSVIAHPGIPAKLCSQAIYNYVYFHMVPSPGSVYQGVHKLQAAHQLIISGNTVSTERYWLPDFQELSSEKFVALKNQLRHKLTQSVTRYMGDPKTAGAFLSGGLDSSTVTGILSEVAGKQARAFSIGFSAEGYDEMAYARITAKHFAVELNEYYVTPEDIVSALPLIATSYDEPFGNSSALPAWFCAKLAAEQGIELLLAGDGGDELFAGNERYARQRLFEHYGRIPQALRKSLLEPVFENSSATSGIIHKIKRYIEQAKIPLPDRLQSYNYLHRHNPAEVFSGDFLEYADTSEPLVSLRKVFQAPTDASTLNRMLFLDWQFTLADNDIRKVSQACALAGINVAYPMLDNELVKFSCRIPSKQKLKRGNLRAFYKESLKGWLPDATINKPKQGFGLPFGVWMNSYKPLQELAYDNLLALKKRPYFNPAFMDLLIKMHREEHSHYYGELIWVLVVLEMWLSNRT